MIINKDLLEEKFNKKLTPTRFKVVVSFLNFILTEDSVGVVLYSEDNYWKPFQLCEEISIKKVKSKTYNDLIILLNKNCDHYKKLIKKAKTSFFDKFETSCEVNLENEIFELELIEKDVVLTKHIVCVIKELDNIERSFVKDDSVCRVIPYEQLFKTVDNKDIENWLKYFLKK